MESKFRMVTFDKDVLIDGVYEECQAGELPLSEDVVKFVLGYHLEDAGSQIAFEVGMIGTDVAFSPDADVLEIQDDRLTGYEVKGVRDGDVKKEQLYTGVGQATVLLSQPLDFSSQFEKSDGILRESYLVCPWESVSASEEWQERFTQAVKQTPIGFFSINSDLTIDPIDSPSERIPRNCRKMSGRAREECLKHYPRKMQSLLQKNASGVQKPTDALMKLADKIRREYELSDVFFDALG